MEELAGIIVLGIAAQWIAWRLRLPAILPLIIFGLLVGPISTFFTEGGHKLINPRFDGESGLFPGDSLFFFVSLSIGIILFEGGLTLKFSELKNTQRSIFRLISLGSLVTFIGAGLAAYFIMGLDPAISFLFAGLIIVTGPTVIAPILQNIPLNRNVATVLKWEGILIDPIGALVAVLVYEFIQSSGGGVDFTLTALTTFVKVVVTGTGFGLLGGLALYQIIKRNWVPHFLLNIFILAFVLFIFVDSDIVAHESGLLSVVVMGLVLANKDTPKIKEIMTFKESISVLLISILFILLAANINISDLQLITEDWRPIALFGFVALILRPLSVFLSTAGGNLDFREKLFISWVGPRGIVAAGIASLFGLELVDQGIPGAEYITPLVFMIVLGTVLLNATTARMVARLLGVIQDDSDSVLIVGASNFAITIGEYLKDQGRTVHLVDSNDRNIARAKKRGLHGIVANIYNDDLSDEYELLDVGYLLAFTGSNEVNAYALNQYHDIFGERGSYRLITSEEMKQGKAVKEPTVFSYHGDFLDLSEADRENPAVQEISLRSQQELRDVMAALEAEKYIIPLFLKYPDGSFNVIPQNVTNLDADFDSGGYTLVYLGENLPVSYGGHLAEE